MRHLPPQIVYVRHPQCLHNIAHQEALLQGISNRHSPLTAVGEQQCRITAAYLKHTFGSFDRVLVTEYSRTHAIPAAAGWDVEIESSFNERSMGVWHHVPKVHLLKTYPNEEERIKEAGYLHYRAPEGGETCSDVVERVHSCLLDESRFDGVMSLLISAHGISGLCFRLALTGDSLATLETYERLKNAAVTVYQRDGDVYRIAQYNYAPWEGLIEADKGVEA